MEHLIDMQEIVHPVIPMTSLMRHGKVKVKMQIYQNHIFFKS